MQPFIKGSLKEYEFLAGGAQTGEHGTDTAQSSLIAQEHLPTLQQGQGARALQQQQSRVISKKESLSKKPQWLCRKATQRGPYRSLGWSQTPAEPSESRAVVGLHHSAPSPAPRSPSMEQGWLSSRDPCRKLSVCQLPQNDPLGCSVMFPVLLLHFPHV